MPAKYYFPLIDSRVNPLGIVSEQLVIAVVIICVVLVIGSAAYVIRALTTFRNHIDSQLNSVSSGVVDLSARISALEQGLTVHGNDIEGIRAEFALHITRGENLDADYEQAIKAASSGHTAYSISESYGLRETEAQLLVAVYGGKQAR